MSREPFSPETKVWWHDYVSPIIELPVGGIVCFKTDQGVIEIRLDPEQGLKVRANDGELVVHPRYANEVLLNVQQYGR